MKTTIIYDNTAFREDLRADWGFSALVEAHGRRILFDTGGRGSILLANMHALGIAAGEIDDVFISHAHFDHTGGLSAFLDLNDRITLWTPPSFRGVKNVSRLVPVAAPRELYPGVYSTGELAGIEQSLCIDTAEGIVLVTGCSHPPLADIVAAASTFGRIRGVIGGLHATRPEALEAFALICPTHCTEHTGAIRQRYPAAVVEGGAGRVLPIA